MKLDPDNVRVHTLSLLATKKTHDFHISEARPPTKYMALSTFEVGSMHFFLDTDSAVFKDGVLLKKLLGAHSKFEDPSVWKANDTST